MFSEDMSTMQLGGKINSTGDYKVIKGRTAAYEKQAFYFRPTDYSNGCSFVQCTVRLTRLIK